MHRILLTTAIVLLAGCSSTPVDPGSAKRVPADRVYAYQADVPGGATLVVSRDNGFWASGGCLATVLIDGKKVSRMDTGEIVKFKVKPGRHIVGIASDDEGNGLCAMQIGQPVKETAAEVSSGETQKFRISGTQNGADIRPSSI
ncbi:hypothetical protein BFW91_13675 [Pseudomonas fluorescens]|jgi:hypothetical protein|uniref:hypothetical protein n=1 Tax=Pseudomonas fluorescens TaxID=294 RepID=UPI00099DE59F|nr:hypothetical protein [Pseudomonas fluorescens]NNB71529.1 hypothetical protein [Pseudomonas fluorescens]OPB10513.1 hypothetical protein BFW91_13675 [Pseudomonas fluorescens]